MGIAPTPNRKLELQTLRAHHRGMARDMVYARMTPAKLAEKYGISMPQITVIINSPLFKAEVERLSLGEERAHVEIGQELQELAKRAVEIIAEDLYQPSPSGKRTNSAFKILDRTGYHPRTENVGVTNQKLQIINFTPLPGEDPKEAQKRMIELTKNMDKGAD